MRCTHPAFGFPRRARRHNLIKARPSRRCAPQGDGGGGSPSWERRPRRESSGTPFGPGAGLPQAGRGSRIRLNQPGNVRNCSVSKRSLDAAQRNPGFFQVSQPAAGRVNPIVEAALLPRKIAVVGGFPACGGRRRTTRWRLGPESNRRTRLCRPLHDHSAT